MVEAHAIFYLFEKSRAVGTSWSGQAHGNSGFAVFNFNVIN